MSLVELIFLALALGVDCLVVSFSQGLIFTHNRLINSLRLATSMGLFQGCMPIIGYLLAGTVTRYINGAAKWIVFGIFLILGLNFILEALKKEKDPPIYCIGLKCLLSLGLATSIDALGAGVSLRLSNSNLLQSALIIGLTSFILSLLGFWSGNRIKHLPANVLQLIGGVILVSLGIKALF